MEIKYLLDTNIFLEILLNQEKLGVCKKFLEENTEMLCVSDFSLHSIGVILFRNHKEDAFQKFAKDVIPKVNILSLSKSAYQELPQTRQNLGLDFDDAYQFHLAKENDLEIITMDSDFRKVQSQVSVKFL